MNYHDELVRLGLAEPSAEFGTGTKTPPALPPETQDFIPPTWYGLLEYALTSGTEKGCMIFGPRGSGKSTAIRHLAEAHGASTVSLQCAHGMQLDSLLGTWTVVDGQTVFVHGPLAVSLLTGSWLIAEEFNVAHPGIWSVLNNLTDKTGDSLRLPSGEVIPPHPDFRVAALYNEGAQYGGTREVNAALKRRLMPIYADYPDKEREMKILRNLTGATDGRLESVLGVAEMIRAANLRFDLSTDILARWMNIAERGILSWSESFEKVITDLLGSPEVSAPQRAVMAEIAAQTVNQWS